MCGRGTGPVSGQNELNIARSSRVTQARPHRGGRLAADDSRARLGLSQRPFLAGPTASARPREPASQDWRRRIWSAVCCCCLQSAAVCCLMSGPVASSFSDCQSVASKQASKQSEQRWAWRFEVSRGHRSLSLSLSPSSAFGASGPSHFTFIAILPSIHPPSAVPTVHSLHPSTRATSRRCCLLHHSSHTPTTLLSFPLVVPCRVRFLLLHPPSLPSRNLHPFPLDSRIASSATILLYILHPRALVVAFSGRHRLLASSR